MREKYIHHTFDKRCVEIAVIENNTMLMRLLLLSILISSHSFAQNNLDVDFGQSGIAIIPQPTLSIVYDMKMLPDGRFLAVGNSTGHMVVARYHSNGSLDYSFGSNGICKIQVGGASTQGRSLLIQPDGKIVACGYADADFAVARYHANGTIDTSFNGTGEVKTNLENDIPTFGSNDAVSSSALQPDGKIVVGGESDQRIALVRYNPNGRLDTTFNDSGKVMLPMGNFGSTLYDVVIKSDGKILACGYAYTSTSQDFLLVQFKIDGRLDSTFGTNGVVFMNVIDAEAAYGLALQSDGKIVLAGKAFAAGVMARFKPDGAIDSSFGIHGTVVDTLASGDKGYEALALAPDGKLYASGLINTTGEDDFYIVRYHGNGRIDSSFSDSGTATQIGIWQDRVHALLLQSDGKIIAGGYSNISASSSGRNGALARYLLYPNAIQDMNMSKFKVYPNPSNNNLTVEYHLPAKNSIAIKLYDMSGKCVLTRALPNQHAGDHTENIATDNFSPGKYLLKLCAGSGLLATAPILIE